MWHNTFMHNRSSIQQDKTQVSTSNLTQISQLTFQKDAKNPAAVALGRLGGLKGGKARADSLSAKRRSKIAYKAAVMRWIVK